MPDGTINNKTITVTTSNYNTEVTDVIRGKSGVTAHPQVTMEETLANAYWFDELHKSDYSDKMIVYYVTLNNFPAENTLSACMAVATKIAPDAYFSLDDPEETQTAVISKQISGYSLTGPSIFKADGSMYEDEIDDRESAKYFVVKYVPATD